MDDKLIDLLWKLEDLFQDEPEKYEEYKKFLEDGDEEAIRKMEIVFDIGKPYRRPIDFIDYDIISIEYDWTIECRIVRATKYIRYKDWGNNISEVALTENQWNKLYKKWYVDTYIPKIYRERTWLF